MKRFKNLPCPMRDGIELRMDLYLPEEPGRFPVILMRTPYGKEDACKGMYGFHEALCQDGYAVVIQDCRGTGASDGMLRLNGENEHTDGYDTVEFLATQSYSNGRIGMYGLSYFGFTQLAAASAQPPHLKAICPFMTLSMEPFGASRMHTVNIFHLFWAYGQLMKAPDKFIPDPADRDRLLPVLKEFQTKLPEMQNYLPVTNHPAAMFDEIPILQDFLSLVRGVEDPSFWRSIGCPMDYDKVSLPMLFGTGWYDMANHATLDGYLAAKSSADPCTASEARLLIGPWQHTEQISRTLEGTDFGPGCESSCKIVFDCMLSFFNVHLKDEPKAAMGSAVRYFVTGINCWMNSDTWPAATTEKRLYLSDHGTLVRDIPAVCSRDTYVYDPNDPAPSEFIDSAGRRCMADWSSVSQRSDVITYASTPLQEPLTIAGEVLMHLKASTTAEDTDFCCRLLDVQPDGSEQEICAGLVRARYRNSMFKPEFLTPGEPTEYRFSVGHAGHCFLPEHRIKIQITSSMFPKHNRNLNTKESPAAGKEFVKAFQTVFWGNPDGSCLILPVL